MCDIGVIGIGNVGRLIINKIVEFNNTIQTIYITKSQNEIKKCYANIILNLNKNAEKEIEQIILRKRIFVIGHIGEKEWNQINVEICKKLKKENKEVTEICSYPFTFEGKSALNSAFDTIRILGKDLDKLIITDCDLILRDVNRHTSIKELFELVAEILYSNLQDTLKNVEPKYQKLIVDCNEKCEKMKKWKIEMEKIDEELDGTCCLMMRKSKK